MLLPLRSELRKELGEQMVASGLVGSAMEIFEQLELWDSLLLCYRLLEKIPQALSLVRKRLEVSFFPADSHAANHMSSCPSVDFVRGHCWSTAHEYLGAADCAR